MKQGVEADQTHEGQHIEGQGRSNGRAQNTRGQGAKPLDKRGSRRRKIEDRREGTPDVTHREPRGFGYGFFFRIKSDPVPPGPTLHPFVQVGEKGDAQKNPQSKSGFPHAGDLPGDRAHHRIPTARYALLPRKRRYVEPRKLKFPLFVKSATEDASLGISQASIVYDGQKLRERVEFIHEQTSSDALVEEYIEGRELYIGVMGNERLTTLPVWELNFGTLPDVMSIATRKVKWDRKYQVRHGIGTGPALDLPAGLSPRLATLVRRIYRALSLSGYARIDLRLRPDGAVYVLEANANPNLAQIEDFATSALACGMGYDAVLDRIMQYGQNYDAAWRGT